MIPEVVFNPVILVGSALFGLCLGSFFNVCIYRIPRDGMSISRPLYSFCPHCFTHLQWYENLPVISYLLQTGQCRHCLVFINPRYPIVEILTGAFFVILAQKFALYPEPQWGVFLANIVFVSALIVCSFIDLDLRIIPDEIDKPGMVLAPIISALVPALHPASDLVRVKQLLTYFSLDSIAGYAAVQGATASTLGIIAGGGVIFVIMVFGKIIFGKDAMGFGDVKFMGMIGGFIGFTNVGVAFLLACVMGAVVGIAVKIITKDSYIPFGPFLALGGLAMVFYRREILDLIFQRYPMWLRGALI